MGALILILVVLNAFATGWLLAVVRRMRRTMKGMAKVQRDLALESRTGYRFADDFDALDDGE